MKTIRKTAASDPSLSAAGASMRLIATRVSLLASVLAVMGVELWNAPLMWLAAALAVVGVAAFAAAWLGVAR